MRARQVLVLLGLMGLACTSQRGTIGAVLGQRPDGHLFVRDVPRNLGAARAGLQPGDEILLIDGEDVRQLSPQQIHGRLAGDVGESVKLTVTRGDQLLRITLTRTPARPHKLDEARPWAVSP